MSAIASIVSIGLTPEPRNTEPSLPDRPRASEVSPSQRHAEIAGDAPSRADRNVVEGEELDRVERAPLGLGHSMIRPITTTSQTSPSARL